MREEKKKEEFIAPDGGWGWIIVIACGFSNFCLLPLLQSFGLIFRDLFVQLGISSSRTTSLLNINCAIMSCIGLANGPLYRKYSYRQVGLAGSLISAISISILSVMKTYAGFLIFFSILYAAGTGLAMSVNTLALNTYFKDKRRIATGLSWTCTGLSTIVMPQIIIALVPVFGMAGTVLIYGGFALNAVVCALLLHPVSWHAKKKQKNGKGTIDEPSKGVEEVECLMDVERNSTGAWEMQKELSSGQLLHYENMDHEKGVDELMNNITTTTTTTTNNNATIDTSQEKSVSFSFPMKEEERKEVEEEEEEKATSDSSEESRYKRLLQRVVVLFDLNLLRDPVYINLTLGINFANFAEINFALLTPFILREYGFTTVQVATVMSVLAGVDVASRLTVPFLTSLVDWENRTFFLVGICAMALGRTVLAHVRNYSVAIAIAVLIGAGKGLRTVFIALVIPTHVPLARLPAAIGIHLLISGILLLSMGPVVGWLRDIAGDYAITLHSLNLFTCLTVISWTAESYYFAEKTRSRRRKKRRKTTQRIDI